MRAKRGNLVLRVLQEPRVTAVIVFKKEANPLPSQAIIAHCKRQLAGYKCPKKVCVVDQLPRNAMGKVQKQICQRMISL